MPLIKNCGVCNKILATDKEILCICDKCRLPLHSTCSGLTRTDIQLLASSDSKRRPTFHCDSCTAAKNEISELKQMLSKLTVEIEELKQKSATPIEALPHNYMETVINEINERNNRSSNIIIYNVEESASDNKDIRIAHDISQASEVIKKVSKADTSSLKVYRLGKPAEGKKRPIKVILNNSNDAKDVLKNKSLLKQNNNDIRIASDQTLLQRKYLDDLRKTLNERLQNGENNLTIKYINSIPKIVRINNQKNY